MEHRLLKVYFLAVTCLVLSAGAQDDLTERIDKLTGLMVQHNHALGEMMKERNEQRLGMNEIRHYLSTVNMTQLKQDITDMKEDNEGMKRDIADIKEDNEGIKQDIADVKENTELMQRDINEIKKNIGGLKQDTAMKMAAGDLDALCANNISGPYRFRLNDEDVTIPCDGQGGVVILRRVDNKHEFPNRPWQDYKVGFGNFSDSYWLGLELMHKLTTIRPASLLVQLHSWEGEMRYAYYSSVTIGNEWSKYQLTIGGYSGTAGNSLAYHNGMKFTTLDSDNDLNDYDNCAVTRKSAWWFKNCAYVILSAEMKPRDAPADEIGETGIIWYDWKGWYESYRKVEMKLFLKSFS